MPAILLTALLTLLPGQGAEHPTYYKPGRWVEIPATAAAGVVAAPGTETTVDAGGAKAFALPMDLPWALRVNESAVETRSIASGGWLVGFVDRGMTIQSAHDGIMKGLPAGSQLVPLRETGQPVAEAVDLVIAFDFSESDFSQQERAALSDFVRGGGAVLFIFASREIPETSIPLWRELWGAAGPEEKQAPGLPRRFLVPRDFAVRITPAPDDPKLAWMSKLVWKQNDRGVVLAYGLSRDESLLQDPDSAAEFFRAVRENIEKHRHPIVLGPIEPEAFKLFDEPDWSSAHRARLAALAGGYALAVMGLLASFGAFLARRQLLWIAGVVAIAAGGIGIMVGFSAGDSGAALGTASIIISEPDSRPVRVVFGRMSRLAPGANPTLECIDWMPPRLLIEGRYAAREKAWITYMFPPSRKPQIQPLLGIGQSLCVAAVQPEGSRPSEAPAEDVAMPPNGEKLIRFFEKYLARGDMEYEYHWRPAESDGLFAPRSVEEFDQVENQPTLVVEGKMPAAPVQ